MKTITTTEKIKNGTIRIENGKLIGLGIRNDDVINISALDDLLDSYSKSDVVEALSQTITGIARTVSYLSMNHPDVLGGNVDCMLPTEDYLYQLNEILKFFNR